MSRRVIFYSCGLRATGAVTCWGQAFAIPAPIDLQHFTGVDLADPAMCKPQGIPGHVTVGFPLPGWGASSVGTLRVAVLFVDFPDIQATHTTQREAELGISDVEKYLETFSYGRLDVQFTLLHRWLRAERNHSEYFEEGLVTAEITEEAVRLADNAFDFTNHDSVMIILPSTHFDVVWRRLADQPEQRRAFCYRL